MDLIKIGKFIAELRKEQNLTQDQLGEIIGVTNKTVSRWETGNYLPPADALLSMSKLFKVSINEILSAKRLSNEDYKEEAEQNLLVTMKASSFSLKDKISFYKKKWLKEHIAVMVFIGLCIIALLVAGIMMKQTILVYGSFLVLILAHAWRNNTMMAYVETHAFDGKN